jgi:hypothetical protein
MFYFLARGVSNGEDVLGGCDQCYNQPLSYLIYTCSENSKLTACENSASVLTGSRCFLISAGIACSAAR